MIHSRAIRAAPLAWGLGALIGAGASLALVPGKAITQYAHEVWTREHGLPQISVLDALQTRDGFLWLATYEGLVRFDGVRFETFDAPGTTAITNVLHEDRQGILWIGTNEGLIRHHDGSFNLFVPADGLANNVVQAIREDGGGALWIGTQKGLSRFQDGHWTLFTAADGLPHDDVRALLASRDGRLWIGTQTGLGWYENGALGVEEAGLPPDPVQALYEDRRGTLWIGSAGGGLVRRSPDGTLAVDTTGDGLASNFVSALLEDRDGNLWIGTQDSGVSRWSGDRFSRFSVSEGLSDDNVQTLLEDREGNLWIGTWAGGLNQLRDARITPYTVQEGLPDDMVLPIFEDRQGTLWIGTQEGLSRSQEGRFTTYTTADGLAHDFVMALHQDELENLWIGTLAGLSRFRDGRFTTYTTADGLGNDEVHAILEDHHFDLWVGTWGGGLSRFRDGRFTTYTTADGLAHDFVMALLEDRAGNLWIGTTNGLSRFRDGRFTTFTTADGLAHPAVVSLYEDDDGTLWIGTDGGLSRFRDGAFFSFTVADGLFNNRFFEILEDGRGNLWASCNQGIFRLRKAELEALARGERSSVSSVAYGTADGMKSSECNGSFQPGGWKASDGRLWFPSIRGAVVIDPESGVINEVPPPVVIDRVVVDGTTSIPIAQNHRSLLSLEARDLAIHYSGLSFSNPGRVEFQVWLEGYDEDWQSSVKRRVAYYTNLPPGPYRFHVKARNDDGVWNEEGAVLDIYRVPAFYETWAFYVSCGLALLLTFRGFYRLRMRHLIRRNRDLLRMKKELEARNVEIETQKAELERFTYTVSHDLKNPVVTIQGFLGVLAQDLARNDREKVDEDLETIRRASDKMERLLDELIEMARVGRVTGEPEEVSLSDLVREALSFHAQEIRDGRIDVRVAADLPPVLGDRRRLGEVFQNLVENAVKYMGTSGERRIEIDASQGEGETVVHVRDTGIGIPPRYHEKVFGLFEQLEPDGNGTGVGLALVKRIVEHHGGRIWVESGGEGRGSTFSFSLPCGGADLTRRRPVQFSDTCSD